MAQQDKTTYENTFNDSGTGLFKDNTSKDIGANDSRTLVTNTKDSFLNLVDGGTVIGYVQLGNTGTLPIVAVNLSSMKESTAASGSVLNAIFYIDQSVANTGGPQGVEGYVKTSNATGTVVLAIGTVGNIEHSGAGTLSYARSVQAGGIVSGNGTVSEWAAFYAQPLAITGGGTVTNVIGLYLDVADEGNGTIGNRFGVFQVDTAAVNVFLGRTVIGGLTGSITAGTILDLQSTTHAFCPPRMTKTQRDAISSPSAGMVVYQTDNTPGLRTYNGTNWMGYTETAD